MILNDLIRARLRDAAVVCGLSVLDSIITTENDCLGAYTAMVRKDESRPFVCCYYNAEVSGFHDWVYFATKVEALDEMDHRHRHGRRSSKIHVVA